jgi:hypothetical protein
MGPITLGFASPKHGWMNVVLADDDYRMDVSVSDVPLDSLRMLAMATLAILEGRPQSQVMWSLEPMNAPWVFQREGGRVQIHAVFGDRASVVMYASAPTEFALVVWRALRRLESDPVWARAAVDGAWKHPFPHREVSQLGAALGKT